MICGGGVEVAGGLSDARMLAVDFRLPKPLKREFKEFIREEKEEREEERRGKKRVRGGTGEVEEGKDGIRSRTSGGWIEGGRGGGLGRAKLGQAAVCE